MRDHFHIVQSALHGETLLQKLERYINREAVGIQWGHHDDFAVELREEQVSCASDVLSTNLVQI